jgi:hypothetical protein
MRANGAAGLEHYGRGRHGRSIAEPVSGPFQYGAIQRSWVTRLRIRGHGAVGGAHVSAHWLFRGSFRNRKILLAFIRRGL